MAVRAGSPGWSACAVGLVPQPASRCARSGRAEIFSPDRGHWWCRLAHDVTRCAVGLVVPASPALFWSVVPAGENILPARDGRLRALALDGALLPGHREALRRPDGPIPSAEGQLP